MAQVLDQRDRADVEVTGDQRVVQPVRGVLVQVDVEQGAGAHQAPVDRQAVQELDVPDPGPCDALSHDPTVSPASGSGSAGPPGVAKPASVPAALGLSAALVRHRPSYRPGDDRHDGLHHQQTGHAGRGDQRTGANDLEQRAADQVARPSATLHRGAIASVRPGPHRLRHPASGDHVREDVLAAVGRAGHQPERHQHGRPPAPSRRGHSGCTRPA